MEKSVKHRPISNSTSTTQPPLFMEFTSSGLLIWRNGLPNNPKHKASRIVDFPEPFSPTIKVVGFLSS